MVIGLQVGTGLSKLRVVTTLLHLADQKKPTVHPTGCATVQEAAERGERASEQVAEKMYQDDTTGILLGKHAIGYSSTINPLTFGVDIKVHQGVIPRNHKKGLDVVDK